MSILTQNIRKRKALIASILSLALLVLLPLPRAEAVTQQEINAVRARRDELTAQREAKQAVVDELEEQQAGVLARKNAMDERNMYTLQQIQLNSQEIELYDKMIADKGKELEEARKMEYTQLVRYRTRVRSMEESGGYGLLALLLQTSNLGDFLTVLDDVGEIMKSDRELEERYIQARENTEQVKQEYEDTKTELEAKQEELREEQTALSEEIEEAVELIVELQADIENRREEYLEILAIEERADRQLEELMQEMELQRQEALRRQRAAEAAAAKAAAEAAAREQEHQAAQAGQNAESGQTPATPAPTPYIPQFVVGTGSFSWPVPSCTYITSRFGLRIHPIYKTERKHNGIDIAAGYGATIQAADGGTVSRASNTGDGYGNCVIIDHGNGYITLYGHMSSMTVREGQSVSKGDTIGYVGSTGLSTGPHCHFEVWNSGSRTDPEQFFTGLTFSADAGE